MLDLENLAIGGIVGVLIGVGVAWTYQDYRYDAKIKSSQIAQISALNIANAKTLETERKNDDLQTELANKIVAANASTAATAVRVADVVRTRGVYVSARCPVQLPAAANAASAVAEQPARVRLSDEDAARVASEARRADEAADYARAGHDYAIIMGQWINEQRKQQNGR